MRSIVGHWVMVRETAADGAGRAVPTLFGPMGVGIGTFTAAGRMMAVLTDGRPGPIEGERKHVSYCGDYHFDGTRLVTEVDGATDPRLRDVPQVREARFEGELMVLRPPVGFRGPGDVVRELWWKRLDAGNEG